MKRLAFLSGPAQALGLMVLFALWVLGSGQIHASLVYTFEASGRVYECYYYRDPVLMFWTLWCLLCALVVLWVPLLFRNRSRPSDRLDVVRLNATWLVPPRALSEGSRDRNPYAPPLSHAATELEIPTKAQVPIVGPLELAPLLFVGIVLVIVLPFLMNAWPLIAVVGAVVFWRSRVEHDRDATGLDLGI